MSNIQFEGQVALVTGATRGIGASIALELAQRGLKVDGDVVADKARVIPSGSTVVVQAGKRKFARVTVT